MVEAIARDALGDPGAAERALGGALDLAAADGALVVFLLLDHAGHHCGAQRR